MKFSVALAPSVRAITHAVEAERLGYEGVWLFDSPALMQDVWIHLGLISRATDRVRLGPAVLVPSLRHVITNATALATLYELAPRRVGAVVGSGFSARLNLGQRPLPWREVAAYVSALRSLLNGEVIDWEGRPIRLMYPEGFGPSLPVEIPILIGADGPRGRAVARELGDGIMASNPATATDGFDWSACMISGTVLDDGETFDAPRVIEAAGPLAAVAYHALYEQVRGAGTEVETLPRGDEWVAMIESVPEEIRHLVVHEEHMIGINDRDRPFITGEAVQRLTASGKPERLRTHLARLEDRGVTETVYYPVGPDIPRELERFAEVVGFA